ncbi:hypothetical protein [Sedimentibacter sp. B4]|uniref:hypothetical protein n=1 Tax=Sedimentibacter sp. B4 TaxID=304766 RepID=UPI0002FF6FDB|nr:hypothetical protein [Sedimentibacter sp. B4]
MSSFLINNITSNDFEANILRILVANKIYFPISDDGHPCNYNIRIKVGSEIYDRIYRYYRNKSGKIYLRNELFKEILKIETEDILKVIVLEENKTYEIIKL